MQSFYLPLSSSRHWSTCKMTFSFLPLFKQKQCKLNATHLQRSWARQQQQQKANSLHLNKGSSTEEGGGVVADKYASILAVID